MTNVRSAALFPAGMRAATLPPTGYALRRVESREDWKAVRELRARALRRRGDLPDESEGFPDDGFDGALNSATYLLTRNGRVVGSTRTGMSCAERRWPLPSIEPFHAEIAASIGWEATLVEASLNVVDPDLADDSHDALFHLLKAPMLRCLLENADWLLIAVPESQIGFHRRMFNMEILSGIERYPRLALPRVLMGLEYRRQAPLLYRRIPTLVATAGDERLVAGTP